MTYQEMLEEAKGKMQRCKVCPTCNGVACRGVSPGPGGKGSASTFRRNVSYLAEHVFVHMDVVGEEKEKNTEVSFFGQTFAAPVFCAPIGVVSLNYTEGADDYAYNQAVMQGTKAAGTIAFGGGGLKEEHFLSPLEAIKANDGWGIPTLKPWDMATVRERIPVMETCHPVAFAMDIDSAGLPHAGKSAVRMVQKSQKDLQEITQLSPLPFIVKGIMTTKSAKMAADAGAYGIVVSNHGGRVLDGGLSTAEVLPEIRAAVGDRVKVFVDGGVRSGVDVFKMLALGADAVLIARPYAVAAFGGGAEGVKLYTEKIIGELKDVMIMTNCACIGDITAEKIRVLP